MVKRSGKSSKLLNVQARPKQKPGKIEVASGGGDSTTYYVHGPQGIHAQQTDGEWKWMVQDSLGNVRGVVDDALALQQSLGYDPLGRPISVVGTPQTMYGYTGEPTDPNGLVYLRERYYNPGMGAFISQDQAEGAINDPMSLNGYAYAHSDPVNRTDPSRLNPIPFSLLGNLAISSPWHLAMMMNTGCFSFAMQQSTNCAALRNRTPPPSVRELIAAGCIGQAPAVPPTVVPGQEILPVMTGTPSSFHLPVDNGILSNCDFVSRTPNGLPSRDVNPPSFPIPVPVYAPANGEVMIVDTTGDNAGLGNFVAIRIHTSSIPQVASQFGSGYIYIGYAHLSQVSVQSSLYAPYPAVTAGQEIGQTGNTGIGGQIHLDVTVFFVPDTLRGLILCREKRDCRILLTALFTMPVNISSRSIL